MPSCSTSASRWRANAAQCVGLTPAAVEGNHQLSTEALAERMFPDQLGELARDRTVLAE